MKYLLVFVAALAVIPCGKVKLVRSVSQEWVGGLRESGYGTDFRVTLRAGAGSDKIAFEDLWVGEYHMKPIVQGDYRHPGSTAFSKGDTLMVRAGFTIHPDAPEKERLRGADFLPRPANFNSSGLLVYRIGSRRYYLKIKEFTSLEKIIYP
jgi:hypothetical protein